MTPRLITLPAAAVELGVSVSTLEKQVAAKTVQVTRVGRRVMFSEADLDAYIASRVQPSVLRLRRLGGAA